MREPLAMTAKTGMSDAALGCRSVFRAARGGGYPVPTKFTRH
jgi:hypothetical protein